MKRKPFALVTVSMIALLCVGVSAEVVYEDEHGVRVEYRITDTRKYVHYLGDQGLCAVKSDVLQQPT